MDATAVEFNGVPAFYSTILMTRLLTVVPTNATTGPITVRTPAGTYTTTNSFTVSVLGAPVITNVSPTSAAPGAYVSIQGYNLINVISVTFNGMPSFFGASLPGVGNSITAMVPDKATTGPITVSTTSGSFTTPDHFVVTNRVYLPPSIYSFSPASGPPGTVVTIAADPWSDPRNSEAVTEVRFNGISSPFKFVDGWKWFVATVPADATTGPIHLVTPGGISTSTNAFIVLPGARLLGFAPEQGPPGTVVQVLGSSLDQVVGVELDHVPMRFSISNGVLSFTVSEKARSGPVTIATPVIVQTSTRVFSVTRPFDLGLSGEATVTNSIMPATVTCVLHIANHGPETISNVVATNWVFRSDGFLVAPWTLLPDPGASDSGITLLSATSSQGQCFITNLTARCELGALPPNAAVEVQLVLQATRGGVIYHLAEAGGAEVDPDSRDNRLVSAVQLVQPGQLIATLLGPNQLEIRWLDDGNTYGLEFKDALSGNDWTPLNTLLDKGPAWTRLMENVRTNRSRFYRLVTP